MNYMKNMSVNVIFLKKLFRNSISRINQFQIANIHNRALIGNRDWVGFGKMGSAHYSDEVPFPFPAIRFKENDNELLALREKEKGDWRKLSVEEKKILYRASFRQTFSEFLAPSGEWKSVLGGTLIAVSLGIWIFLGLRVFIHPPLPRTFDEDYRRATLRRMLDLKMGHLTGISSKWDYEKNDWKK